MTAKEAQRMKRLEIENRELRAKLARHIEVYGSQIIEIVEMRAKLELVDSAIHGEEN